MRMPSRSPALLRPRRRAVFALATALALAPSLAPSTAVAQPAADPTLAAAHARFDEGVKFFDKGEFENARAAFLQAYALHKHPAVLINLAQSSLRSGHTLEADRYFTRYIHDSANLTPAQRAEADKGLAEARTKLGRIDVLAPAGTAVTIDGELAGTDGSTSMDVEPGSHSVKGGTDTSSVTVAAGQTVMVKLGKTAGAPPPAEPLPVPEPIAPPTETVTPPPPQPTPPPPPEPAESPGLFSRPEAMSPVWIGAGVSLAGFATAIIFAVFKGNAQTTYNGQVSTIQSSIGSADSMGACVNPKAGSQLALACQQLTSDGNDVSADATVANVGIAAGVVGAAFAAGWYLFAPKQKTGSSSSMTITNVAPIVGSHVNGLGVGGTF
jgi:tetratricopeptide (TPR) repeat protein